MVPKWKPIEEENTWIFGQQFLNPAAVWKLRRMLAWRRSIIPSVSRFYKSHIIQCINHSLVVLYLSKPFWEIQGFDTFILETCFNWIVYHSRCTTVHILQEHQMHFISIFYILRYKTYFCCTDCTGVNLDWIQSSWKDPVLRELNYLFCFHFHLQNTLYELLFREHFRINEMHTSVQSIV